MNLRRLLLKIHLIVGLVAALVLLLLGVTGAVMVFELEIYHALNSKLFQIHPEGTKLGVDELVLKVETAQAGAKVVGLQFPSSDDIANIVTLRTPDGKTSSVTANPYTGEVLGSLAHANNSLQSLHQFHKNLLLGEKGKLITGWGALLLLVLSVTGLVLWRPRRLWKFSKGAAKSGRRTNFDLHNVLGFYSSIFMLIFGATGAVIHWDDEALHLIGKITGLPPVLAVPQPSPPAPGAEPLRAGAAFAAATKAVPGAAVNTIQGLGATRNALRITMRFPEDATPAGRTNVYLHPVAGEVLMAQSSRTGPMAYRFVKLWNRQLHTGDSFGWPSRILACLMSLALPLLAITGPLIWWGRVRRKNSAGLDLGVP